MQTRQPLPSSSSATIEKQWRSTGIVGLRERGLKELPSEVVEIEQIRVLDLDRNEMTDFPRVEGWKKLKRLRLSNNKLGLDKGHGLSWSRLSETPSLVVLFLDNNLLVELPEEIGSCTKLEALSLRRNRIVSLHENLWSLAFLKRLDLSHNRIRDLSGIGRCGALVELHLSHNEIDIIPDEIGKLKDLTCLSLDHNRIVTLPSSLFVDCIRLHTLTIQDNPIRSDHLREVDGYMDFDRRRRSKHDKQMDMRVFFGSKGFEEIADP